MFDGPAQLQPRLADLDTVAERDTEPVKDRGIDYRTELAFVALEGGRKALRRR